MKRLFLAVVLSVSTAACGVSTQQEVQMGQQYSAQINQQLPIISDPELHRYINVLGDSIAKLADDRQLEWHFYIVDSKEVNAFAVPGGFIYINRGLIERTATMDELAGVLGHEIGHVVARHGAEHLAKAQLIQGLGGAAVIASYDPDNPQSAYRNQAVAAAVGQLVNMRFGRDDELESDRLGVRFIAEAGYDPRSMLRVMEVLAEAGKGRGRSPEFFSTHPNPENRMGEIERAIKEQFPNGLPAGLEK